MQDKLIAIAGIHTGIGKTIASAVLAEAMGADYWKPIQAGIEECDKHTVQNLITNGSQRVHQEAIVLTQPLSPHAAASIDGVTIDFKKFQFPQTDKLLLVETAGGVLSPVSGTTTMADFMAWYSLPAILVVKNYLGSINHTLLSIEVLKTRGIRLLGLIINGEPNEASENFIVQYSGVPIIARIPLFRTVNPTSISKCAETIPFILSEDNKINPTIWRSYFSFFQSAKTANSKLFKAFAM